VKHSPVQVRATSQDWDTVRGCFYIMEPSDFPEGCGVVLEADSGKQWGIGKNKLGATVKLRLYTPLCDGCDQPIPSSGICSDCRCIHADIAGDPMLKRRRAA
jgi:hypothetical protein